ncbi:class I SAM-dependent methyltransferase [Actinomycetospora sp. TBRC 11914]|uniref:class I SAM-dependent methyltransferase n=1 Tax=Actinomycetospora sp. TBRC 11914 TaxID=2729387 RepID=UPI00145CB750|nr:class I SAM-dependent methyltransferase [Actinomycetospora sp. TBRC 11914]NMO88469.1 class I SAM-dependent methyltransferase [Actinomycetospora sp. TBRC 11914]
MSEPTTPAAGSHDRSFLPALGTAGPLSLYDAVSWLGARSAHRRLVGAADPAPGQTVLEIGCGTGNLLLAAARAQPAATVIGLDPDSAALDRAHAKARRRGLPVRVEQGFADELPHPDGSVDRVLSAFMFHHLPEEAKEAMLREVRRVLAPGGVLFLVDFEGLPRPYRLLTPLLRAVGHGRGHGHGDGHGHGHGEGHGHGGHDGHDEALAPVANDPATVRSLLAAAGFTDVAAVGTGNSPFGRWVSHRAVRGA